MKIQSVNERVRILNDNSSINSVIKDIANSGMQQNAFYVCDIGDIVRKCQLWRKSLPRVEPFYAVKCNDNSVVLDLLTALKVGFCCSSKSEIQKVLPLVVDCDRIIFANPAKPTTHIKYAANVGISTMSFDNETELLKIKSLYPDAKMVLRISCDDTYTESSFGVKFGCDPSEAPKLLRIAQSLDINVVGVSFHLGADRDPMMFQQAIKTAREVFDEGAKLGYDFYLLDIGGGFPGGHGESLDEVAEIVNSSLETYFPDTSVKVIAEPGRYFVSSAYSLACNIHTVRNIVGTIDDDQDPESVSQQPELHFMYYINDGVYGSFNCILYGGQVAEPEILEEKPGRALYNSSIWGPTFDGLDRVCENILLPEMKAGEWLVFKDMGAYTFSVSSQFNGFPVPNVHFVADESMWSLTKDVLSLNEDCFLIGSPPSRALKTEEIENANAYIHPALPIAVEIPRCEGSFYLECDFLNYIDVGSLE